MTREEQIREAVMQSDVHNLHRYAFMLGAEWADSHPHWISVDEELPQATINDNVTDMVLTCLADERIRFDRYMHYHHKWVNGASEVTHWMPMPQPPKKGGEK